MSTSCFHPCQYTVQSSILIFTHLLGVKDISLFFKNFEVQFTYSKIPSLITMYVSVHMYIHISLFLIFEFTIFQMTLSTTSICLEAIWNSPMNCIHIICSLFCQVAIFFLFFLVALLIIKKVVICCMSWQSFSWFVLIQENFHFVM